ncbi:XRE family transcriptional regulator [Fibrella aestuarina]|nr:XRE family transcriptional regulator [Fibrella aestuarina]
MTLGQKLFQLRSDRNWSQEYVANEIGVKKAAVSKYEKDHNRPALDKINLLARLFNVSQSELMDLVSSEDTEPGVRELTMAEDTTVPYSPYNARERSNGGKNNMWVVEIRAQAGFVRGFPSRTFNHQIQRVSFPMIAGECFCFEVEGFSMYPLYLPGSFVVCTLLENREWMKKGKAYVFQTDDGIAIKLFESFTNEAVQLASENPSYNPVAPMPLTELRQVYLIEYVIDRDHNRHR